MDKTAEYQVNVRQSIHKKNASPVVDKMQEEWVTFKIIEDVLRNSKFVDHTVFDELYSEESPKAFYVKNLLKSIERLALHWDLLDDHNYKHRLTNYDQIDRFINEIPRAITDRYFPIKTFILSCRRLNTGPSHSSNKVSVYQVNKTYPKE